VCYIADDVCLTLITGDSEDFFLLRECKRQIVNGLSGGYLDEIVNSLLLGGVSMEDIDTQVPELRHFTYRSEPLAQLFSPRPAPPFHTPRQFRYLFRRYQHLYTRTSQSKKRPSIYFEVSESATLVAWIRPGEFEMYATFTPLVTKEAAVSACNRALRWIKKEENSLFIVAFPVF